MKWLLVISALASLAAGMVVGFLGSPEVLAVGFFSFVALLIAANLDQIAEFKATGSGVEAKTREVVQRAENAVRELHVLALQVAELTLSLAMRQGRWGGYSDDELTSMRQSVFDVLKKLGVSSNDSEIVLREWHMIVEHDYAAHILGGSTIPKDSSNEVLSEWKQVRGEGFARYSSPREIRAFLEKYGFMTPELFELLNDYEFYRENRVHRRPEVWREREHWDQLKKA
jgi:hypothetical protein